MLIYIICSESKGESLYNSNMLHFSTLIQNITSNVIKFSTKKRAKIRALKKYILMYATPWRNLPSWKPEGEIALYKGFLVIYEHDEQELMGYGVNIS